MPIPPDVIPEKRPGVYSQAEIKVINDAIPSGAAVTVRGIGPLDSNFLSDLLVDEADGAQQSLRGYRVENTHRTVVTLYHDCSPASLRPQQTERTEDQQS
jgi:hypothetical protein